MIDQSNIDQKIDSLSEEVEDYEERIIKCKEEIGVLEQASRILDDPKQEKPKKKKVAPPVQKLQAGSLANLAYDVLLNNKPMTIVDILKEMGKFVNKDTKQALRTALSNKSKIFVKNGKGAKAVYGLKKSK